MKKRLALRVLLNVLILMLWGWLGISPAFAADLVSGAKIFNANCAACHVGGGNVVNRAKTLKLATLQKYKMDSADAIKQQVINGKNSMPSFRARLTEAQVENVAQYVLAQAKKGW